MRFNEEMYKELCSYADKVTKSADPDDCLIANGYLHIIRAHPSLLDKYNKVFRTSISRFELINLFFVKIAEHVKWLFSILAEMIPSPNIPFYQSSGFETGIDILFVSHFLNKKQLSSKDDFYYGNLPQLLRERGYKVAILYLNQTAEKPVTLVNQINDDGVIRIFLNNKVSDIRKRLHLIKSLIEKSAEIKNIGKESCDPNFKRFCRFAAHESSSRSSGINLELSFNFREVLKSLSPKGLVLTYEGHAWEKLFFNQAKINNPSMVRAGYIHAAIFSTQHSLYQNISSAFSPDVVFTTGEIALEELASKRHFLANESHVLGTHKIPTAVHDCDNKENVCLVLPEGLKSECEILFNFSLALARRHPEIRFIWRLHPVLSFNQLNIQNIDFSDLPANIELSENTFEIDIETTKWALYRGSSAIIAAMNAGAQPLYLKQDGEIDIDPIHQLGEWKKVIRKVEDFREVVAAEGKISMEMRKAIFLKALDYCNSMYEPFNPHAIERLYNCP